MDASTQSQDYTQGSENSCNEYRRCSNINGNSNNNKIKNDPDQIASGNSNKQQSNSSKNNNNNDNCGDDGSVGSDGVGGKMITIEGEGMTDQNGQHHPIPEFLYQLTKMLTDDNSEIIEWQDGRIKVHYPERLEGEVLARYFRHSKFASFQRQLNYFGFRKIAGKGKMSPCSYVNEAATDDIRSLLLIKRKTNGSAARKAAMQQRAALNTAAAMNPALMGMNLNLFNAAAAGQAGMQGLNGLPNAMSLLSENALRAAGLGQLQQMQNQAGGQGGNNLLGSAQLNLFMLQQQLQQQQQQLAQQQLQHQSQQQMQQQQQNGQQIIPMFTSSSNNNERMMLSQDQQQQHNTNNSMPGPAPVGQGNMGFNGQLNTQNSLMQSNSLNQNNGLNMNNLNGLNSMASPNSLNQSLLSQGLGGGGLNQAAITGQLSLPGNNQFKDMQNNQSSFTKNTSLEQLQAQLAASLAASQQNQNQQNQGQQQCGGNGQQNQNQQNQQNSSGQQELNNSDSNNQNSFTQQMQRQLQQQRDLFSNFNSLGSSGLNLMGMSNPATAALKLASFNGGGSDMNGLNLGSNPASAALLAAQKNANPASAALDAATGAATSSLFESAVNLKSLLQEHQESATRADNPAARAAASQALLNRLPSSSAIFPDSLSTASFGHLLGSSNRLNSLVSLNSFGGSRETSLADFATLSAHLAAANNGAAAAAAAQQLQSNYGKRN